MTLRIAILALLITWGLNGHAVRSAQNRKPAEGPTKHIPLKLKELEGLSKDTGKFFQTARAVPYLKGKQFAGFTIQSIDANSPFHKFGVKKGDTIVGFDDVVLDNIGRTVEVLKKIQEKHPTYDLHLLRAGKPLTLHYTLN
jgi:type II secretory pathway component PulC